MSILQALVLGIIEGITEFLPISSTGHLILASELLKVPQTEFLKSFEIAIQLGAIFAVVFLYWKSLILNWEILKRVAVAFAPTAVIGLVAYKFVKNLLGSNAVVLWALLLGGIFLIIFEYLHKEKPEATDAMENITYGQSFLIGLFQSVAMIPGVSRAAATIVGGLLLGLKRRAIVEFSFLLAVPTMAAATGLDLIKSAGNFSSENFVALAVGFVVSFVVAILAIKFLLSFIKNHTFKAFGVYRIALAVIFAIWLYFR